MHQTLFYIPYDVLGLPVFGFGLLMVLWLVGTAAMSVWYWLFSAKKSGAEFLTNLVLAILGGAVVCFVLPKAGKLAGIPVQAYGTMMLLGIVLAYCLAAFRAKKFGFTAENVFSVAFIVCVCGILGARAFYVIEYWSEFQAPTLGETLARIANIPGGGLVVYGSLIGGVLGGGIYMLLKKLSIPRMLDLLAPSMLLGLALGRIGCFLNGCCFGGLCDPAHEFWGVHFPAGSPPFNQQLEEGKIDLDPNAFYYGMKLDDDFTQTAPASILEIQPGSLAEKVGLQPGDRILNVNEKHPNPSRAQVIMFLIWETRDQGKITLELDRNGEPVTRSWVTTQNPGPTSLAVYPTQLYSSLNAAVICVILLVYSWFRRNPNGPGMIRNGEVFLLFLTLYPLTRFILEMIRNDEANALGTKFTISQNVSLVLLLTAAVLWVLLIRSKRSLE
ncbi:MAG: prolipoprotein diacylglyceryl transferase [Thermoguttaceae bacterium]|nr:prolipoprotein diacylglyceryl transferase [Thermoguttaceae bacterium]